VAQNSDTRSAGGSNGTEREGLEGAERAGQAMEELGSRVGRGLAAVAARIREEVEDIWAEAQSIRKGERD
jgi:hypothetical protein